MTQTQTHTGTHTARQTDSLHTDTYTHQIAEFKSNAIWLKIGRSVEHKVREILAKSTGEVAI